MELFLVRHGQTQENADGIVQGWLDTGLNATGREQIKEAAQSFSEKDIDIIFSSDLKRCIQTAEVFRSRFPDVPYVVDARLRERNFGDAQGTHGDTHDWEAFWASSDTATIPNAETLDEHTERVRSFMAFLKEYPYKKVLVITHGGTINRLVDLLAGSRSYHEFTNASVTKVLI